MQELIIKKTKINMHKFSTNKGSDNCLRMYSGYIIMSNILLNYT